MSEAAAAAPASKHKEAFASPTGSGGNGGGGGKSAGGRADGGGGGGRALAVVVCFMLAMGAAGYGGYVVRDHQVRTNLTVRFMVPGNASIGQCGLVLSGSVGGGSDRPGQYDEACATEQPTANMPAELRLPEKGGTTLVYVPVPTMAECPAAQPQPACPVPLGPPPTVAEPPAAPVERPAAEPPPKPPHAARAHRQPRHGRRHAPKARCCEPCWRDDWWAPATGGQ